MPSSRTCRQFTLSLRYGNRARTFCALTRWNVLSYRHCCRGIATVTRSVARRSRFPAWQPQTRASSAANSKAPVGVARGDFHRLAPATRHLQSSLKPRPTVDYTEFGIRRLTCVNLGWLGGQARRSCGSSSCNGDRKHGAHDAEHRPSMVDVSKATVGTQAEADRPCTTRPCVRVRLPCHIRSGDSRVGHILACEAPVAGEFDRPIGQHPRVGRRLRDKICQRD